MKNKKIVFTGGGSAGHVTPNLAIINELKEDFALYYIGSHKGIEKEIIQKTNLSYYSISSGKLRRYIDMENIIDAFRVLKGTVEARKILKKIKPDLLFSKGGFVSVPVIVAASSLKIPIYIHESDITPGLANRISMRFASKIFTSFEEAAQYFPIEKVRAIGSPIRKEILNGSVNEGLSFLGFQRNRPILTIMGGSLGAKRINEVVRESLGELTKRYQIVHLCGKGQSDPNFDDYPGYKQFEYIHEELAHILAATQYVITRGGSNALFEFLALNIPMLIIPLSKKQSRGDQILNANAFKHNGFAIVQEEEGLDASSFILALNDLENQAPKIKSMMDQSPLNNGLDVLLDEITGI